MFGWLFGKSQKKRGQSEPKESSDLVIEDNVFQQAPSGSLRLFLRTVIADAQQIGVSIKMRAAEAARTIAQAQSEVQAIQDRAERDAQKRAEEIISAANRQAEITEVEAKQKALQFLISVGEEAEKEIEEEYKRAYSRLSSSLQALINEGRNIEMELRDKTAKLLEDKSLALKEYGAMLLGTSEVDVSPIETAAPVEAELKPDTASQERVEEPVPLKEAAVEEKVEAAVQLKEEVIEEKVKEPVQLREEAVEEKVEAAVQLREEAVEEKVEEPVQLKEEVIEEKVEAAVQLREEAVEEKVEEPVQLKEKAVEEKVKEPVQLKEEAVEEKVEEPVQLKEEVIVEPAQPELDRQALYVGEVELTIASPIELKLVSRLYNYLQTVPELKILYTRGSWDRGTTITVVLEKPMPLLSLISQTPGVGVTPELLEKDSPGTGRTSSLPRGGERQVKRIKLNLKEAESL